MPEKEVAAETNEQENGEKTEVDRDLENAIIRQVEYYFSDANMSRDKFLQEQTRLDEGWVPFEVLIKFNRLAKLSTDTEVIANAISNSTLGLLEVSDDNKKLRRNPNLPVPEMNEERRKEYMSRSVYVKGFPLTATLDDLLKYFNDFEGVEHIFMRKYIDKQSKTRKFKGSVFVQFKTREQAEKLINTPNLKHNDTTLLLIWHEQYVKQKQEEYLERKDKKMKNNKNKGTETDVSITRCSIWLKFKTSESPKEEFKLPTGSVFHFSECGKSITREDIKAALTELGAEVAFVDFKTGDTNGWVRLSKENAAKEIEPKITDGKLKIGDSEVVFKLLEGEEEKKFLDKTVETMVQRRKNQRTFKSNKSKPFKGKYNRKRKQDPSDEAPAAKVKADA
ncbi:hypothetical protein ACJJTC_015970 [Scirpophaga incertulas]